MDIPTPVYYVLLKFLTPPRILEPPCYSGPWSSFFLHTTPEISVTKLSSIDRDGTTVTVVYLEKQSDWIKISILPSG